MSAHQPERRVEAAVPGLGSRRLVGSRRALGSLPVEVQRAVLDLLEDRLGAPYPKPSEEPGHPDGLMKPHAEVAHPDVPQHRPVDPSPPDLLSDRTRIPITGMEAVELGEASHEDRAGWLPGCRDAITPRSHGRVPLGYRPRA